MRTRDYKRNHRIVIRLFSTVTPNIPLYIEPEYTRIHTRSKQRKARHTPEKAASTCKPTSTGKERPSRRSGKPKLARRAAVKEGEPSRPLYHLSRTATFPSLSLPFSRPHLSFSLSRRFSLPLSFSRHSVSLSTRCPPPLYPGFPFTRNPFLFARCSTADDNPFSTNDLLHSPANPVPFPAESL